MKLQFKVTEVSHSVINMYMLIYLVASFSIIIIPVSLGMLVLSSKDWHEKNENRIFHTSKHTFKQSFTWQKSTEMQFEYYTNAAVILNKIAKRLITLTCREI